MKNVEIFNPAKKELQELANKFKDVTIKGITDTDGYKAAKEAKKELSKMRVSIKKFGKSKRDEAIAFQREVIRQEKEHLEIIIPVEDEIKEQIADIDEKKKMKEREVLLPMREEMLQKIDVKATKKDLLAMDEKEFTQFYNEKKDEYDTEQKRIKEEKDAEIARKEEIARERANAAQEAKERAEREANERVEKVKRYAEAERLAIIDAQAKKEREDAEAKEKAEKNKKYMEWKEMNSFDDKTHIIKRLGNSFIMYKVVSEIRID